MALNELLIISIQTRLKGSLLIGHCKQEPLLMLHNCPWARPARLLRGARWGDALGWCVPLRGGVVRLRGVLVWGCACPHVHARQRLCVPIWGYAHLSRVVCVVWICVCLSGVVFSSLGLCLPVSGCPCTYRAVYGLVHPRLRL